MSRYMQRAAVYICSLAASISYTASAQSNLTCSTNNNPFLQRQIIGIRVDEDGNKRLVTAYNGPKTKTIGGFPLFSDHTTYTVDFSAIDGVFKYLQAKYPKSNSRFRHRRAFNIVHRLAQGIQRESINQNLDDAVRDWVDAHN